MTDLTRDADRPMPDVVGILPLRGTVLFPQAVVPLGAGRASSVRLIEEALQGGRLVGAVTQKDPAEDAPGAEGLHSIGTLTVVHKALKQPDGTLRLVAQGVGRFRLLEIIQTEPYLKARIEAIEERAPAEDVELEALVRSVTSLFSKVVSLSPALPDELVGVLANVEGAGAVADMVAASFPSLPSALKQELLETVNVRERLTKLAAALGKEAEVLELGSKIQSEIQSEMTRTQRDYYLREQMKAIQKELGEGDERTQEIDALRAKIEAAGMSDEAKAEALRELDRLAKMPPAAAEDTVAPTYIDWLAARARDEAEIRGHRRTYIGALPGQIVQGLRRAGTKNPVLMLDEVDKLGMDFRGDPASALLEVLDPEQNGTFRDHYLDVPFDLSRVLFITTANVMDTVPAPLRDRMEIINLAGYTEEEKVAIAQRHLVPKQGREHGLDAGAAIVFEPEALRLLARGYTREAGVRNLEREIASVCRKVARRRAEGNAEPVRVTPDVVVSFLGVPRFELEEDVHVHVPAGAIPKDGPSAGVTMATALVSLLTGRPVRSDLAMTGEISLSGRVLPVGGIKEKVLAAHRAGLRTVVLPRRNEKNLLEDVPVVVRQSLTVHLADTIGDVLTVALEPVPVDRGGVFAGR